jgi:hypothetical protein
VVFVVVVAAALIAAAPHLFEPHTWMLLRATRELGPISGFRCAQQQTYTYEPARQRPDDSLLADPPEATLLAEHPLVEVDRVEVNLHGGDAVVWTHAAGTTDDDVVVYVLSPGRLRPVTFDSVDGLVTLCDSHLGAWQIVGEQSLG